jgi:catechol 2,3-dioxygenase-like lactoylglutathione lyase family enzyme
MNDTTSIVDGVNVISIYVSDLDAAKAFYVATLGLMAGEEMAPGVMLSAGDMPIYLEGGRSGRNDPGMQRPTTSICFSTPSVREAYAKLHAAGVPIIEEYNEIAPTFAMFRIADPDGNVVEFAGKP